MLTFFDGKRKSVFGLVSEVCMRERDVTTPPGGVFIVRTGKKKTPHDRRPKGGWRARLKK